MTKYSALSEHLAAVPGESTQLTFSQIEEILGKRLPLSASKHRAWWANEISGTHTWSHLWRAAGWLTDTVDFDRRIVTFRRAANVGTDALENLRPRTKETIFDLLQQVGISTDEWLTRTDGNSVTEVKANPNFCYNWSFGSLREGFALCIWHSTLEILNQQIVFNENLRELAVRLKAEGGIQANNPSRKTRAITQSVRARSFDEALNLSYRRGKPVSVILTEGDRRSREESGEGSSHVQFRTLDPIKWYVHRYDDSTGEALLVRGVKPAGVTTDGSETEDEDVGRPDEVQQRAIKIRRGQAQFREKLLAAYGRTCAVTGCKVVDLLEAAHIQPHADEPNYRVTNGLLLRADIHTLFDLNLLSVDALRCVQLAPTLLNSEYRGYEGKRLRQPDLPSEMPDMNALDRRYREFKQKN